MNFFKLLFLLKFLILISTMGIAQSQTNALPKKPKLIIGIVVDQMRYDFLYKYETKYSDKGIKRLLAQGYSFENTHYNYVPTYTGPGHASIYTGSTPAYHGIVGNDWYVREDKKTIYVTEDKSVKTVGSSSDAGEMSPRNLLSSTITDELKMFSNKHSKVIGVALKDRGAILPAGHGADAAYWYDGLTGNWITSTYYMRQLPEWVNKFNDRKLPGVYLSKSWDTVLPIAEYTESTPDNVIFEVPFKGEKSPVFPHNLSLINKGDDYALLRRTPFGNTFTTDFVLEILKEEKLGQGQFTDFLAISFSSTDYIGHQFGPNSIEVEDTYLRLDKEIERLLTFVDETYGKDNVLIFLTADHGAAHSPKYLKTLGIPGGILNLTCIDSLKNYMNKQYGAGEWLDYYENQQIYLNHDLITKKNISLAEIQQKAALYLQRFNAIQDVIPAFELNRITMTHPVMQKIQLGHNPKRSGDVIIILQPGFMDEPSVAKGGTTHGSPYNYDTHVPLLWYGWKVGQGKSYQNVSITDIAPTLSAMLRIMEPNASIGKVLTLSK